ncbi:hypothetical protein CJF32_00001066 [Rutstroemia sp. NJR-2017a WRK4]|nr:hypothetical protein CJF32_00005050 [Rutstroemia sp. NJR-2017a WRK4]PQE32299.1 hypothetical protein CJF32_00001066 [Rutstroemia sp. NJR-2017a WRK4]
MSWGLPKFLNIVTSVLPPIYCISIAIIDTAMPIAFLASLASAATLPARVDCIPGTETILSTKTIDGKDLINISCKLKETYLTSRNTVTEASRTLEARNRNLCGAPCTTYCNSGTGGPNPNDCSSLASSIQNNGGANVAPGSAIYWTWGSCQAYIVNTSSEEQYECWDQGSFGGVVNYLAWNCQGSTSGGPYLGGSCHWMDSSPDFVEKPASI